MQVIARAFTWIAVPVLLLGCAESSESPEPSSSTDLERRINQYAPFELTTDVVALTDAERNMLPLLIEAAKEMDPLFMEQSFGPPEMVAALELNPEERRYFQINYGPWDRLAGNEPFLDEVGPKPPGANLYPVDMTKEEFEAAFEDLPTKERAFKSLYTLIRRDASGDLIAVPYHEAFGPALQRAAAKLREAAELAEDPGLKNYLQLRAEAIETDEYFESDMAWMDMKDNGIDVVIGAIETYEDQLFGYKAGFEAYVLVKDRKWSERLSRYATLLPELQRGIPVPDEYKQETPGSDADLNAYDAVYYAGEANAGSKTIAINLPNDERVQLEKGTRRLQLKNSMRAKFDKILEPIASVLIDPEQREHVTFDAFFSNTMFHEVAHGLGIKNTIDGSGTVREALRDQYSSLEEGKADVLGLYMVMALNEMGELDDDHDVMDNMVTFVASIFRSIRFGASSAHGRANLVRFNFFDEAGAFVRDQETGTYRIHPERLVDATNALSEKILRFQGDGDYQGVLAFMEENAVMGPTLEEDLTRLGEEGIPVDIVFEQGMDVLQP